MADEKQVLKSAETVSTVNLAQSPAKPETFIDFVPNASKNEKAPKFIGQIWTEGVLSGCATPVAVYLKDGVPQASVPSIYGNASLSAKRIPQEFNGVIFYRADDEGQRKLDRMDAAVRVAFYGWQKSGGKPQPFSLD